MKKHDCPICGGLYFAINLSFDVCKRHQNWIITMCDRCNRYCFSDCIGTCRKCYPDENRVLIGGGKDRRAVLRSYGLESYNG